MCLISKTFDGGNRHVLSNCRMLLRCIHMNHSMTSNTGLRWIFKRIIKVSMKQKIDLVVDQEHACKRARIIGLQLCISILNLSMFCSFQYSQNCKSKSLILVFEFILHLSLTHNCLLTSISAIIIHENLETTTQNVSKQQRIYLYRLKILRHVY